MSDLAHADTKTHSSSIANLYRSRASHLVVYYIAIVLGRWRGQDEKLPEVDFSAIPAAADADDICERSSTVWVVPEARSQAPIAMRVTKLMPSRFHCESIEGKPRRRQRQR